MIIEDKQFDDGLGNKIHIQEDGLCYLTLNGSVHEKNMGEMKSGVLWVNKNDRHIFKKSESWAFNYALIKMSKPRGIVVVASGKYDGHYKIGIEHFEKYKHFMHFKSQGFELQAFINIELFTPYLYPNESGTPVAELREKQGRKPI